ncbi:hypothetical protein COT44_03440 [Candidatus Shapirobacteria bacterium CG08_land_8_20_14_0_20_39_18]|uniref:Uncharacterized protein n=1 Tax=Candidatus Shapirobacteria bacterium CG08_land_8_20_14_0_20_39_18 TaxID=1974883 RepID=A0A2M6XCS2_9BACT|nr:MAG: hypothetical protein COT44_03440 [Candidatus Shapirobacteria bacterium CG08_land_8_20_14_0_20_39_18]PJE68298.1 MAG: hypothetical protein COU94_02615 [Candidatus Shapirobacteria bacterium CG10_big_fil_rev_8_21_14_0_10_38_8]
MNTKFRIFVLGFLLIAGSLAVSKPVLAFSTPEASYPLLYQQAIESPDMNLQSFVRETIKAIMFSFADQAGMPKLSTVSSGGTPSPGTDNGGLVPTLASLIGLVYQAPPASGLTYLADLGSKVGIAKPAYAQDNGIGFTSMEAVLPLWKAFRDMSYLLFVLVFVITGFAIMFRFKVDPRTIITLEAALPKIIIGLILVTFSYAIAGFLVDLMWIINNLLLGVFHQLRPDYFSFVSGTPVTSVVDNASLIIQSAMAPFEIGAVFLIILGMIVGGVAGIPFGGPAGMATGAVVGALILLIIFAIVFIIALFRLLWTLLKAYVNVVLAIIFAPFLLAFGALPASSSTGAWFKNILSNLAVLPVVLTMLLIANFLVRESLHEMPLLEGAFAGIGIVSIPGASPSTLAEVQQVVQASIPARVSFFFLMIFVALGLMLMTPHVADMIKNVLAGKSFGDRLGIGEAAMGVPMAAGRMGAAGGIEAGYRNLTTGKSPVIPTEWQGLTWNTKEAATKKILSGR